MKKILLALLLLFPLSSLATMLPLPEKKTEPTLETIPEPPKVHFGGIYPVDTCNTYTSCLGLNLHLNPNLPEKVTLYWYRYVPGDVIVPVSTKQTYTTGKSYSLRIPLRYEGKPIAYTKLWLADSKDMKKGSYCILQGLDQNQKKIKPTGIIPARGENSVHQLNLYAYRSAKGIHCVLRIPEPPKTEAQQIKEAEENGINIYEAEFNARRARANSAMLDK